MNIRLSPHQEDVLRQSLEILDRSDYLLIEGQAGVGKTTLINFLIRELLKTDLDNRIISVLAPTNKAVSVIRNKVNPEYNDLYRRIKKNLYEFPNLHNSTKKEIYDEVFINVRVMYDLEFKLEYFDEDLFDIIFSFLYNKVVKDYRINRNSDDYEKDNHIIEFATIHSALHYKKGVDENLGKEVFGRNLFDEQGLPKKVISKGIPLINTKIIIVDESSMVGKDLLKDLYNFIEGKKIIFIGDPAQIPPVNEYDTPVFEDFLSKPECIVKLTEIVRQEKGNPILGLSRNLDRVYQRQPLIIGDTGYSYSNDMEYIIGLLLSGYDIPDKVKFISFENKYVDMMNLRIRDRIYSNPDKVEKGEILVLNSIQENTEKKYYINYELEVLTLEVVEGDFYYHYGYQDSVSKMDNRQSPTNKKSDLFRLKYYLVNGDIKIIHEDSEDYFKRKLDSIITEINYTKKNFNKITEAYNNGTFWWSYYRLKNKFTDIKYNHALTIHKSQGSTYRTVIIHLSSLSKAGDKELQKRLLYTAITRASEKIIFV